MIGKLCEEVDVIQAESLKWKEGMDRFAAEKEAARAQLSSVESQLQSMKEKSSVQVRRIEELEAPLASELAKAESDAKKIKRAKELEADVEALPSDDDDDDDGSQRGSESREEPDGEETSSGDNQET
uniref:RNA polymerase II-associated factor 1 homolog n=1 Tax=Nicotiana tabacum TaxID=4097 RepID=A0A1S3WZI9_TOBAC|nr:PREDICTED: RNA polymerase II-associated factor 1 homolog [Nicotiana tabacum]